jgi:hypothetical protein
MNYNTVTIALLALIVGMDGILVWLDKGWKKFYRCFFVIESQNMPEIVVFHFEVSNDADKCNTVATQDNKLSS